MALSNELIQAVNRYGPSVAGVAKRYGISGEALLAKLITGESGGRRDAVSSAGARSYTQFIPSTRREVIRKFGIDPWGSPDEAVHAAALHLRGKVTGSSGLEGYNPGSPTYTNYILGQRVGDVHRGGRSSGSGGGSTPVTLTAQVPTAENTFDPGQGSDLSALAGLLQQPVAPPPVQAPQAPNSSQRYLSSALTSPVMAPAAPREDLGALLTAIQGSGTDLPSGPQSGSETVSVSGSVPNAQASTSPGHLPSGIANFEGRKVAAWIAPALRYARRHGWKGDVQSGYRSYAEQKRIYDSGVRPAAVPGRSNHEGSEFPRGAVDVSDPQALARILRRSPYANRLVWAGAKDPVHFSHPHGGSY